MCGDQLRELVEDPQDVSMCVCACILCRTSCSPCSSILRKTRASLKLLKARVSLQYSSDSDKDDIDAPEYSSLSVDFPSDGDKGMEEVDEEVEQLESDHDFDEQSIDGEDDANEPNLVYLCLLNFCNCL